MTLCQLRSGDETARPLKKVERTAETCILIDVSKFSKFVVLMVLALWAMAAMHCKLESLPGLSFLKTCCFVDSSVPISPDHCDSDGCGAVEEGGYRMEEATVSAPRPALILALFSTTLIETLQPVLEPVVQTTSFPPPDLPKGWQFSLRTALSPRAPSFIA